MVCSNKTYALCRQGSNYKYGECCNHSWYVVWNIMLWGTIFLLIGICTYVALVRRRRIRQQMMNYYQNQEQNFID